MAEKTTNYQCPACTGPLHYDGASGKLVCDYCGSAYDVKDIEARYAKKQAAADTAAEGDAKKAARLPRQDNRRHHLPLLRQPHSAGRQALRQAEAGIHPALQAGQKGRHCPADQIL